MFGLIGKTLKHSYSKIIHEELSKDTYHLIELDSLDSFFQEKSFIGLNVTIPYKYDVIPYLDELSPIAKQLESVNTIVNDQGRLKGYNTDYEGLKYLLEYNEVIVRNKDVLILGNGASSRLVKYLAKELGAANIIVAARNPIEGEILISNISTLKTTQIIFNTTPVGMFPNNNMNILVDFSNHDEVECVVDLIYNPLHSKLLIEAKKHNIKAVNGLLMLVHQAVKAHEYFHQTQHSLEVSNKLYQKILLDVINIVFIGMPMSGKTFYTKQFSKKYDKEFIDIDQRIVDKERMSIENVFRKHGEKHFRSLENLHIKEVYKQHNCAVSCGGGIILNPENIALLKQNGIIVFLDAPLDFLRKMNRKGRPLLKTPGALEKLFTDRYELYEQSADIIVTKDSFNHEEIMNEIEVKLYEHFGIKRS